MTGRKKVQKYKKFISALEIASKIIPKTIFKGIYNFSCISDGRIALLIRFLYVKKYTKSCGENIYIGPYTIIKNIENLSLGSNISIHAHSYIDAFGNIKIGDNVSIASHCSMFSFNHTWSDNSLPIKYNAVEKMPIKIENDIWIGSGVKVLGGVVIQSRSVVAAGAVVNKNVKNNSIFAGVPAKEVKKI